MIKKTIEVVCFSDAEKEVMQHLQDNIEDICHAEECSVCPLRGEGTQCAKEIFNDILYRLYHYHSTDLSAFENKE